MSVEREDFKMSRAFINHRSYLHAVEIQTEKCWKGAGLHKVYYDNYVIEWIIILPFLFYLKASDNMLEIRNCSLNKIKLKLKLNIFILSQHYAIIFLYYIEIKKLLIRKNYFFLYLCHLF